MARRARSRETDHRLASKLTIRIRQLQVSGHGHLHSTQSSIQLGGEKQMKAMRGKVTGVSKWCRRGSNLLIQTRPRSIKPLQDMRKTPLTSASDRSMKIKDTKKWKEFHIDKVKKSITGMAPGTKGR